MRGFAAQLSAEQLEAARSHADVVEVEQDTVATLQGMSTGGGNGRAATELWNLDRIDRQEWDNEDGKGGGQVHHRGHWQGG
ncbi:protease inhibitor I9 family protein [Kitasatospora purpeofusca]|uniref:protease inhibitor I9 family protein n=1 Tax=Kitasatospora purpeofusca TaxID=67352 RepID=UPI003676108A